MHNSFQEQIQEELVTSFKAINRSTKPQDQYHALRLMIKDGLLNILGINLFTKTRFFPHFNTYWDNLPNFNQTFNWLADDYSKNLMIKLLARKMLPGSRVLPPIRNIQDEEALAASLIINPATHSIMLGQSTMILNEFELSQIGYDICAELHTLNIVCAFLAEQYRYQQESTDIGIQQGDIAIDAGGCWGDTALYMAAKGAKHIFSFEFVKDNLDVFKKNLNKNSDLSAKITIVENALWDCSGEHLSFNLNGPATRVSEDQGSHTAVTTISIDDFVTQQGLNKIDFIKMDIEGAEANALLGAKNTLKKYAPRLAITVYHRPEDLATIPQIIKQIQPAYDLYLGHYMPNLLETVLFATVR